MDKELKKYLNIIIEALNNMDERYYNLKTTYEPAGIVRERVFCYELYHQIRCVQTKQRETKLSLNGEIDKRGHPEFDEHDQKNPDFVFHIPGKTSGNTIVMEVKGKIKGEYTEKCIKDFKTLEVFVRKYHYKVGIFLLYNYSSTEFIETLQEKLKDHFINLSDNKYQNIIIICKKDVESDPEVFTLEKIIQ